MRKPIEFAGYPAALAQRTSFGPYRATVGHVHDGDTLWVFVDLGLNKYAYEPVRIKDINTPELNKPGGPEARDCLAMLLPPGTPVVVTTYKAASTFEVERQSFERYVADVHVENDGLVIDVAVAMIAAGHAERVR